MRHCGEWAREKLVRGDSEFMGGEWREGRSLVGPGLETENLEKGEVHSEAIKSSFCTHQVTHASRAAQGTMAGK